MSNFNVAVAVVGTVQQVAPADLPANINVTISGQPSVSLSAAGPYVANFVVVDGTYSGEVQAVRADGSAIGAPISFSVNTASVVPTPTPTPAPATTDVPAFVPASVSVTVTAA